jgi:hypothetical protein
VTTVDDMALVRRIMCRHIRDERTIILAVIPSNIDVSTQEILTIAKEVDPECLRTLGVLTKPNLIDSGGEENVMSLVDGKQNPLRLGYCIVRNRGHSELSSDSIARHRKEKLLKKHAEESHDSPGWVQPDGVVKLDRIRRSMTMDNALVTVFLRTLEYSQAIMFLTTDKVG